MKVQESNAKWLPRLALLVLSTFFALLILEIVCRLFLNVPPSVRIENLSDAQKTGVTFHGYVMRDGKMIINKGAAAYGLFLITKTGIRLKKNVTAIVKNQELSKKDIVISTNSQGYRYKELGIPKRNEFRILDLGDSITFGEAVESKDTYSGVLERYLTDHAVDRLKGKEIEAINAGVASIDLQNYFSILMESGLSIQPDVVVVGLYLNDADVSPVIQISRIPPPLNKSYLARMVFAGIDILRTKFRLHSWESETAAARDQDAVRFEATHRIASGDLNHIDLTNEAGFNRLIAENFDDWGYAWSEGFWKRILPLVDSMQEVCHEKNIRLVFLFFPVAPQVYMTDLRNAPQVRFEKELRQRGISHLDLLPALRDTYSKNHNLFFDQCHLTVDGHRVVGEAIGRFLLNQVIDKKD